MKRRLLVASLAVTAAVAAQLGSAVTAGSASAAAAPSAKSNVIKGTTRALSTAHTTRFVPGKSGVVGAPTRNEIQGDPLEGQAHAATARAAASPVRPVHDRSLSSPRAVAAGALQHATALKAPAGIVRTGAQLLRSFDGLNHYDQRTAGNGNQYSTEPPDQALCVGQGYVVEGVNTAVRVDSTSGKRGGVMTLSAFFGLPPAINRTTGVTGPSPTDPSCVYDSSTKTFYFAMLELATDPSTGAYTGANSLDLAVTKNPLGSWRIYRLPVQNDGTEGTPVHPNCPCIGDYPHIGFDSHGFYLTTNEYSFFGPQYNSAQIYAFDKVALAVGAHTIYVTEFDTTGADQGRPGFTVWPAQSPSGADFNRSRGGTEYFLSSNAATEARGTTFGSSHQIVIWTLTGTSTFGRRTPSAVLHVGQIGVRTYAIPPMAPQKAGPAPLLECLNTPACRAVLQPPAGPSGPTETLSKLDSNDTRMQQVTYAHGLLYGALDTAISFGSQTQAGIAWYVVRPTGTTRPSGRLVSQGQFGLADAALIYPALGVNSAGKGVMTFTLSGPNYFPSAAFVGFSTSGPGPIKIARAGKGPEDGFAAYIAYQYERPRWGDYGAASVVGNNVWIASEYIGQSCTLAQYEAAPFGTCGGTRTALANWGTRISLVRP